MSKQRAPRSISKYIREEKGKIRKGTADRAERDRLIAELVARFGQYRHDQKNGA